MDSEVQKNNQTKSRDYDKEPIVIEDYNYIFGFLFIIPLTLIVLYAVFIKENNLSNFYVYAILPAVMFPFYRIYFKARKKRKIILTNTDIQFLHETIILEEIRVDEITDIRRTYSIYYHKSQIENDFHDSLSIFFFPVIVMVNLVFIVNKFFFHLYMNALKGYKFFDAIIIFSDEKFINILPTSKEEYEIVRSYFLDILNIDIKEINTFTKYSYTYENIKLKGEEQ
jgi:hypothetical protein